MNKKFHLTIAITRRLPRIRGMIGMAQIIGKPYIQKGKQDVILNVLDFKMLLTPGESLSNNVCILAPHLYDRHEVKFLNKNLKIGETFVDLGAHIGFYSLVSSRLVGEKGKVVAIEADPFMYKKILYNIKLNNFKNIIPLNYGVSDKEEELELGINKDSRGKNSFLREGNIKVKVKCFSLKDILKQNNIKKIKCLKVDIEGFEYKVLKSFLEETTDKNNLPEFIITEYDSEIYQNKLMDLLLGFGYKIFQKTRGNYIFVK